MQRFNPGLEDEKHLDVYAYFFKEVQSTIESIMNDNQNAPLDELDEKLGSAIAKLPLSEVFPYEIRNQLLNGQNGHKMDRA